MFEADRAPLLEGGRLLADGLPHPDLARVRRRLGEGASWHRAWHEIGDEYEAWAARDGASEASRGGWLWLAAMAAHVAQLYWFDDLSERRDSELLRADRYRRAAPHLLPPAEQLVLEVPGGAGHRDAAASAFLRLPGHAAGPTPAVVLLGGLDSTKEESRLFEELCTARGLATLVFDGPGQGETASSVPLGAPFGPWVSAAVDLLAARPEIDPGRIGLLGRSLGGTYALGAAPGEDRLAAVVAWSPLVSAEGFTSLPEGVRRTFAYAAGRDDAGDPSLETLARAVIRAEEGAAAAVAPTLVWQGGRDHLVPAEEQGRLGAAGNDHVEVEILEGGSHCGHAQAHVVRPALADWLAARLEARVR